ncbi:hypothetical protein VNO78_14624 [Psophocarpus tetragonolobus]|uniref:Uncharacterized protein n=1 Tax=Psophocarpus tetragonolobus TaxID=3891 RepID=A0AAN9SEX8_PSOTE
MWFREIVNRINKGINSSCQDEDAIANTFEDVMRLRDLSSEMFADGVKEVLNKVNVTFQPQKLCFSCHFRKPACSAKFESKLQKLLRVQHRPARNVTSLYATSSDSHIHKAQVQGIVDVQQMRIRVWEVLQVEGNQHGRGPLTISFVRLSVMKWKEARRRSVNGSDLYRGSRKDKAMQIQSSCFLHPKQHLFTMHSMSHDGIQCNSLIGIHVDATRLWNAIKEIGVVGSDQEDQYINQLQKLECKDKAQKEEKGRRKC